MSELGSAAKKRVNQIMNALMDAPLQHKRDFKNSGAVVNSDLMLQLEKEIEASLIDFWVAGQTGDLRRILGG